MLLLALVLICNRLLLDRVLKLKAAWINPAALCLSNNPLIIISLILWPERWTIRCKQPQKKAHYIIPSIFFSHYDCIHLQSDVTYLKICMLDSVFIWSLTAENIQFAGKVGTGTRYGSFSWILMMQNRGITLLCNRGTASFLCWGHFYIVSHTTLDYHQLPEAVDCAWPVPGWETAETHW